MVLSSLMSMSLKPQKTANRKDTVILIISYIFFAVIVSSLLLLKSNVLPYKLSIYSFSWIASLIFVFAILKLHDTKRNVDSGATDVPHDVFPPIRSLPSFLESWCHIPSPLTTSLAPPPAEHELVPPPEEVSKEVVVSREEDDDEYEPSMEETWKAIMEGRVEQSSKAFKKSNTWEWLHPEVEAEAETTTPAVARSWEPIKSETITKKEVVLLQPPPVKEEEEEEEKKKKKKKKKIGIRSRDIVPVVPEDELFMRAEWLIKKHHNNLRLQRLESEENRIFIERLHRSS